VQRLLATLRELHPVLIAALDAGDVDQVADLVIRREDLLSRLVAAHAAATAEERQSIRQDLAALLPLDRDLQQRASGTRDQLRLELDRQRDRGGPRQQPPVVSGVLDRQA
jgi:hypothetical protein